ncbi:DUF3500 domain-containing protein [Neolewinella persica]|uniref:DUF3500 domain-containing protein n=1 Tax=Neolewinella persica TaxID=70998 RepID=UPI00036CE9F8|nr:DUF3500 domain-containing protein [Neolewinella persica]
MRTLLFLATTTLFLTCTPRPGDPTVSGTPAADRPLSFMEKMQLEALKTPFTGVATSSGIEADLFPVRSTGVSTEPIVAAANVFLQSLTAEQKSKTHFAVDHEEWRRWSNVDNGIYARHGVSLKEMALAQRTAAEALLKVSLSAKGLQLSKDIMKTDQTLREFNDDNPVFDEELYFFTIMGTPSTTEPWGWQIDGHHLIINYFILGDQVVMTPTFMGGEPIITTTGKYAGNTLFQDEQNIGLRFMQSLPPDLQAKATLSETKRRHDAQAEAFKDNIVLDYAGLLASEMSPEQQESLLDLANQYISNMRDGHARVKLEDIRQHLADTKFAWSGATDEDAVFYYRIHSPVVLIEFDHQAPVGAPGTRGEASRNHIHTVVRTPNGNDYGKDLLRQHLETHPH